MRPLLFDHSVCAVLLDPGTRAIVEGFLSTRFRHGNVDLARPDIAVIFVEVLRRIPLLLDQLRGVKVNLILLLREELILFFLVLHISTNRLRHEQTEKLVIAGTKVRLLDLLKLVEMNRVVPALLSLGHFAQLLVIQDGRNVQPEVKAGTIGLELHLEIAPHFLL